jgi:uncharacterized membrane protein (UPF0127 family)
VIDDMSAPPPPRSASRIGAVSRAALVLVVAMAVLVGCGGDDGEAAPPATQGEPTSTSVAVSTTTSTPGSSGASTDCPEPEGELELFSSTVVTTTDPDAELCLLLADTGALRQRGLMEVTDLGVYDGMLFAYASESGGGYWMRNTPMPLSIAWVAPGGEVVGTADMDPCADSAPSCPSHDPGATYQWAVEVPQGGLGSVGLDAGAAVDVSGWPLGRD